ncbi:MAG: type 4a pilus biogenesis protein PilO [Candidatus Paceibacterota bacterium]
MSSSIKTLSISCLVVLVVSGIVIGFFYEIRSVNSEANAIAEQVRVERERQQRSESVQETLENNVQEINSLGSYIVGADETPDFLSMVEEVGTQSGATISTESVETLDEDESDQGELLQMNVVISGSWQEVYRSVALIETLPFKITVTAFNFSQKSTGEEEGPAIQWEAKVKLDVVKLTSTL